VYIYRCMYEFKARHIRGAPDNPGFGPTLIRFLSGRENLTGAPRTARAHHAGNARRVTYFRVLRFSPLPPAHYTPIEQRRLARIYIQSDRPPCEETTTVRRRPIV